MRSVPNTLRHLLAGKFLRLYPTEVYCVVIFEGRRESVFVGLRSLVTSAASVKEDSSDIFAVLCAKVRFSILGQLMTQRSNSCGVQQMMNGEPGAIRTPDPQIRSLMLYPAELRVHLRAMYRPLFGIARGERLKIDRFQSVLSISPSILGRWIINSVPASSLRKSSRCPP